MDDFGGAASSPFSATGFSAAGAVILARLMVSSRQSWNTGAWDQEFTFISREEVFKVEVPSDFKLNPKSEFECRGAWDANGRSSESWERSEYAGKDYDDEGYARKIYRTVKTKLKYRMKELPDRRSASLKIER